MAERTLNDDTIINDIMIKDHDISSILRKLTFLSNKSSNNSNNDSINFFNNITDNSKPIITSAIEIIRGKSKCSDIDAIYRLISKSETTN